jgi:hypothetical protein
MITKERIKDLLVKVETLALNDDHMNNRKINSLLNTLKLFTLDGADEIRPVDGYIAYELTEKFMSFLDCFRAGCPLDMDAAAQQLLDIIQGNKP